MNVHVVTLGCKVNFCESESISQMFLEKGFDLSNKIEDADIVVVNSCSVTSEADRKTRQMIHKIKRLNPTCILALIGCAPQAFGEKLEIFSETDIVLGNKEKLNIVERTITFIKNRSKVVDVVKFEKGDNFKPLPVCKTKNRCRAFLKIQDGCNNFCSYCIIPYARGRSRSKSLNSIFEDAKSLSSLGFKEIVLVGIDLSSYGIDIGCNICDAIETVCKVDRISRIRLSSIDPQVMTPDIVNRLSKIKKLCPHFHLSLQSGSDSILKSMNRPYTRNQYMNIVSNIREKIPKATITTDIMVGFPGESESDFEDTLNIISRAEFLKVHVFPYSIRPGTKASFMKNQISKDVKSVRVKNVIDLSSKITKSLMEKSLGETCGVLFERKTSDNFYEGYTENYIPARMVSGEDLRGKILNLKVIDFGDNWVIVSK